MPSLKVVMPDEEPESTAETRAEELRLLEAMLFAVTPRLKTGHKMLADTVRVNAPEGQVAALLAECQRTFPDVAMGSYPFFEDKRPGTNLVLRSTEEDRLRLAKADLIKRLGPNLTISE